jgi:O-antigen/teichoic acid export membrane protein
MVGIRDTGIYTVGSQIGMMMLFITASFNMAWVPWLFEKLKHGDIIWKQKIVVLTYLYSVAILLFATLLGYLAPWFFKVFIGKEFTSGSGYVVWIALGYAFNGMYMMVTNYLFYAEKTYLVSIATFVSAIVNVAASYVLIRMNGAVGAAQGAMLAHFSSFLLTWYFSARVYPMPWNLDFKRVLQ